MKRLLLASALVLASASVASAQGWGYRPYGCNHVQPYFGPQPFSYNETVVTWPSGGYREVSGMAPTPMGPRPFYWYWFNW